jgi:hypothetical protein
MNVILGAKFCLSLQTALEHILGFNSAWFSSCGFSTVMQNGQQTATGRRKNYTGTVFTF